MTSDYDRRAEVEALLSEDETVLGNTWRYDRDGLTSQQMMEAEGVSSPGWIYNYRLLIRVLRDGEIPTSPSFAQQAARRVRSWLEQKQLSDELRVALVEQESLLNSRAEDKTAQAAEMQDAIEATASAEAAQVPGIYVYTLPHYLRRPYDPVTGRTSLKVGHSAVDAHYRASRRAALRHCRRTRSCCGSTLRRNPHAWRRCSTLGSVTLTTPPVVRSAEAPSGT